MDAHWQTHTVSGHAVEVLTPNAPVRGAVLWLHGYDQRSIRGETAFEAAFSEHGLLVVCPAGGQSWWLDLPSQGFDTPPTPGQLVVDVLPEWIEHEWRIATPRIALAGIGMGGQGAINLGFRNARRFPVVAAIAPDIDFHQWHGAGTPLDQMFPSREAARQQTATLHLHPLNWPRHLLMVCDPQDFACLEGSERLASKLFSSGIPFERDFETRAGGHAWEYFRRMAPRTIRFISENLRSVADALPTHGP
jgi:S-formylglutathione hydrolase